MLGWRSSGLFCLVACVVASFCAGACAAEDMRVRESFDFGWKFVLGDVKNAERTGFDDSGWRILNLPHDWSIEGGFDPEAESGNRGGFVKLGIGWYRKTFVLPQGRIDKKTFIQFDGIYKNSDVWINGHHLGTRWYGYASFQYDLTPYLRKDGSNVFFTFCARPCNRMCAGSTSPVGNRSIYATYSSMLIRDRTSWSRHD